VLASNTRRDAKGNIEEEGPGGVSEVEWIRWSHLVEDGVRLRGLTVR
jgi:hypothetical protein